MNQSLRPSQRIRQQRVFQTIFKKGKFVRGSLLNLWVYERPGIAEGEEIRPQIGISVSRKVAARAVKRNLWRRRIREAFRRKQVRLKPGIAVLIQSKYQDKVPSYWAIENEMEKL